MKKQIRRASGDRLAEINQVIAAAKSHWGYPETYLQKALRLMAVTEEYLAENLCFEISVESRLVGFFSVNESKGEKYLDHLWIHPGFHGRGLGREACDYLFDLAHQQGWSQLLVLPDPEAMGFYVKAGFTDTGIRVPSRIEDGPMFSLFKKNFDGDDAGAVRLGSR